MNLYLAKAIGRGSTELAAFDAALVGAGVANFDLIRLSSVISPSGKVLEVERRPFAQEGGWGDRLYAVCAEQRTGVAGEQVWAGVGWAQDGETGRELFVEHEGTHEQDVRDAKSASLRDLQAIRELDLGPRPHVCSRGHVHRHPDLRARDLRVRHRALAGSRARGSRSPGADRHVKPVVGAGIPALRPATGLPRVAVTHAARR